jgi:undecaprenyl phosphate N,N'-diacetylbacillosamine 1-phosphate transferase
MYAKYIKRPLDFILALIAFIVLLPLLIVLTILGAIMMRGNPFFVQPRPGKNERIFKLIKFRTMTNKKDKSGNLLPDEKRLTRYGKFLRSTSLDELPELINIIKGDMSIVGPRPLLVRDMVFMTPQQRLRHTVRPGLTGLAQVNGRNGIGWEERFTYDLLYIQSISFFGDLRIILKTVIKVLLHDGINEDGAATATDYGDYLLNTGEIDHVKYEEKQHEAEKLLYLIRL